MGRPLAGYYYPACYPAPASTAAKFWAVHDRPSYRWCNLLSSTLINLKVAKSLGLTVPP
jgi:hypothetical protein